MIHKRESVRAIAHRHCICTDSANDPKVMINHSNLCDAICDAILEYASEQEKGHDSHRTSTG